MQGKDGAGVDDEVLACLMAHDYPGNNRELENVLERAFVICRSGLMHREHLPAYLSSSPNTDTFQTGALNSLHQVEASFLMNALRRNGWSRQKTARQLGMHKTTLFRKMKSLGLSAPLLSSERYPPTSAE